MHGTMPTPCLRSCLVSNAHVLSDAPHARARLLAHVAGC